MAEPTTTPTEVPATVPVEVKTKKTYTQAKTKERRNRLKKLIMRGYHSQETLAKALECSRSTIERDLIIIHEEIDAELAKEKVDDILKDFMLQTRGSYEDIQNMYSASNDDFIKLRAQKQLQELREAKIKILQSLGMIKEVAPAQREPLVFEFIKPEWKEEKEPAAEKEEEVKNENKSSVPALGTSDTVSQQPGQV